jgi:hypothetical protein
MPDSFDPSLILSISPIQSQPVMSHRPWRFEHPVVPALRSRDQSFSADVDRAGQNQLLASCFRLPVAKKA